MDAAVKSKAQSPGDSADQALYEIRRKIYPRAVSGTFATSRWLFVLLTQLVFYGSPWLTWNGRQAVLFELAARKFYIFGLVFWPQDIVYLTVLLVICAYSLFLFTAVAGGYGAATRARRPSTPRSSCGSSARWKAIAQHACGSTRSRSQRARSA